MRLLLLIFGVISILTPAVLAGTTACTTDEKLEDIFRDKTHGEIYQGTTKRGMLDLSDEIDVRIQGVPFRIPHGYQQYWFEARHLESYEDGSGVEPTRTIHGQTKGVFAFWFPDLDWPHFRSGGRPVFWKCSDKNSFLIKFYIEDPFLGKALNVSEKGDRTSVDKTAISTFFQMTQNTLENIGETLTYSTKYGLKEIYRESDLTRPTGKIYYTGFEDDARWIFIRCVTDAYPAPYQTCRASMSWLDGLSIDIRFLKEAMPEWEAIIEAAHDLAVSWQENVSAGGI